MSRRIRISISAVCFIAHPPRLIWLRIGNRTRDELVATLTLNEQNIRAFDAEPNGSVLVLAEKAYPLGALGVNPRNLPTLSELEFTILGLFRYLRLQTT